MNDSVSRQEPRWVVREDGEGRWALVPYHTSAGLQNDAVLRRELRRIAIEDNDRCFGCGFEHNCGPHGCAIIREALERLKLEETNIPLTPEQLLELEGEPVWISYFAGGPNVCMLVDAKHDVCWDAHGGFAVFENLGRTWIAYRRKPEASANAE